MQNIQKSHSASLKAVTFGILAFGLLFMFEIAQANESYEYVRSYSSDDGRSEIKINTHTSSNSNTNIRNRVSAYSNSNFATNSIHASYENGTFSTSLTGSQEVPPVSTVTTGHATFDVGNDDDTIAYDLDVWNGDDITAAHLHCAPEGANGPVAVSLFTSSDGIDVNGNLESGEIVEDDITDNCSGINDLGDLIEEMEDGDIYVNVHSVTHPDGLIRGQLNGTDDDDEDDVPPSHLIQRIEELLEIIRDLIGNR